MNIFKRITVFYFKERISLTAYENLSEALHKMDLQSLCKVQPFQLKKYLNYGLLNATRERRFEIPYEI